jgi:hypothetical protein
MELTVILHIAHCNTAWNLFVIPQCSFLMVQLHTLGTAMYGPGGQLEMWKVGIYGKM